MISVIMSHGARARISERISGRTRGVGGETYFSCKSKNLARLMLRKWKLVFESQGCITETRESWQHWAAGNSKLPRRNLTSVFRGFESMSKTDRGRASMLLFLPTSEAHSRQAKDSFTRMV